MDSQFEQILRDNLLKSEDKFTFLKGFGKDLQSQFPNGQWKTINGAKVFVNNGKVVAGLDNFNGLIDKFFEEKEAAQKKEEHTAKKNFGDSGTVSGTYFFNEKFEKWQVNIDSVDWKLTYDHHRFDSLEELQDFVNKKYKKDFDFLKERGLTRKNKEEEDEKWTGKTIQQLIDEKIIPSNQNWFDEVKRENLYATDYFKKEKELLTRHKLTGSEKQIKWAEEIRDKFASQRALEILIRFIEQKVSNTYDKEKFTELRQKLFKDFNVINASHWIENKNTGKYNFFNEQYFKN